MAIVQASMAEEILNRSERAVLRGIFRASQLAEAKASLEKTIASFNSQNASSNAVSEALNVHVQSLKTYLETAITVALVSTKVPATRKQDESSSPSA